MSAPGNTHATPPTWGGGGRWRPCSFQGPGCASSRGDGQQTASSGSARAQVCLHHVHSQEPEQTHQLNFSHNALTPRSSRGYMLAQLFPWRDHCVVPYWGTDIAGQWAKMCSLKRKGRKCLQLRIPLDTSVLTSKWWTLSFHYKRVYDNRKLTNNSRFLSSTVPLPDSVRLAEEPISCL